MATAIQVPDFLVRHVRDHRCCFRVLAEKLIAHVGTVFRLVVLELAINGLCHDALQVPVRVARDQAIPAATPDDLDDIPSRSAEGGLEFLYDLAIASYRAIKTLQVAVHDENEIIEAFTNRHRNCAHRLGLIHLTVTEEAPDLAI